MAALLLALSCSHDTPRDNPLDPQLTPPVELEVALDDTAGTATLSWTRYEGEQPFAAYRVLRNVAKSTEVEILAEISGVDSTRYTDSNLVPNTGYEYRVAVVSQGGHESPSEAVPTAGYQASGVVLLSWSVDSRHGAVDLRWQRYQGGRFGRYRVERRRTDQAEFEIVRQMSAVTDTAYRDAGLDPEEGYFYRIAAEAGGQVWESNISSQVRYSLEGVSLRRVREDSQAGAVRLEWAAYQGPDFEAYRVIRSQPDADQEVELTTLDSPLDTTFTDVTARHGTRYLYAVNVQAAGQVLAGASVEGSLELAGVRIEEAAFDARTATATLEWSEYAGPRFAAYRVERRTAELASQEVRRITAPDSTFLVDGGLVGNTRYFHRLVVETEAGEEVAGEEAGGAFHERVGGWTLDVEEEGYVRLRAEPDGRIECLVAERDEVRLLHFDRDGRLLSEWLVIETGGASFEPKSAALARLSDGRRLLRLATGQAVAVSAYGPDGRPIMHRRPHFVEALESLSADQTQVRGVAALLMGGERGEDEVGFDNLRVSSADSTLALEDFTGEENGDQDTWELTAFGPELRNGWGWYSARRPTAVATRAPQPSTVWQDLSLEVDMQFGGGRAGVRVGSYSGSSLFGLWLNFSTQQLELSWRVEGTAGTGAIVKDLVEPFPVVAGLT